jgi:hypothetical protein
MQGSTGLQYIAANCGNNESIIWWYLHPLTLNAGTTQSSVSAKEEQEKKNIELLHKMGLPAPGDGIQIVPMSTLGLSQEEIEEINKNEEHLKKYGYILEHSIRPQELLSKHKLAQFGTSNANKDTHIKHSASELKLAYKFKELPKNIMIHYIGIAPGGGFHENGWSGSAQFFDTSFGSCMYGQINVGVTHFSPKLALEHVVYVVNNKPTIKEVKGSKKTGFVYDIKWFDNEFNHELECANMKYSADTNNSVIALANQIDAYQ